MAADPPDSAAIDVAPVESDHGRAAHAYDYSRRAYTSGGKIACLNDARRGNASWYYINDVHDPREVADMVRLEGLRVAVTVAKRAGIPDAYRYVADEFRRGTGYDAVSASMKSVEAQGFDPTPANNAEIDWRPVFAAEAEFLLRRIVQLRREGSTREARALRELLPERLEWREWTGRLTDHDRRRIAEAEALAAKAEANADAFDAAIRAGEIPDPKNTDLGDMITACLEEDMRRAAAREQGVEGADM